MRRSIWTRVLAVLLIISMVAAPVSAAGWHGHGSSGWDLIDLIGLIRDIIRDIIEGPNPGPTEPIETTEPTEPEETTAPTEPEETVPEETEPEQSETVLNLVEGHENTENGYLLRGVTYTLSTLPTQQEQEAVAPYALRSTTTNTISAFSLNAVAEAAETTADEETTVSDTALEISSDGVIPDGRYVIYCDVDYVYAGNHGAYLTNTKTTSSPWNTTTLLGDDDKANATYFTFTRQEDGTYTIQGPAGNYLQVARNTSAIEAETHYFSVEVKDDGIWLRDNSSSECLNALGADNSGLWANGIQYTGKYFGGWTDGSPLKLYAVTTGSTETPVEPEQPETEAEVVYFPVTMFNYDQDTINALTDAMDTTDDGIYEGFYFSNGGTEVPATFNTTTDMSSFVGGQYYIQNVRAAANNVDSWLQATSNKISSTTQENATLWTLVVEDGTFYLTCEINGETHYMVVGTSGDSDGYTTTKTAIEIVTYSDDSEAVQLRQGNYYLCQWGSVTATDFGGYGQNNDGGNAMKFYRVVDGVVSDTPTAPATTSVFASGYQIWNRWAYSSPSNNAQNMFYGGLVEDHLDENNEIVFTVNEPGIFTYDENDPTITNDGKKDIYRYVGLPFVKNEKGYYTFDSDAHGTYFADTNSDGTSDPYYGASDNFFNMYFDYQNTQGWDGMNYGDGSTNLWAPYNTNENDTGEGAIDYHFGMRADIPFSMTTNGRIKQNDDSSEPITFTFAGDDDVWIFIDGYLVIDLGGIHNRIGATIDFANNTITYFRPESNNKTTLDIGCYNDPDSYTLNDDGTITVKLYNDADGEGALGQTRQDFAADENHKMSIFYLERGEGTSNCKIEYNLPMRDTLLITKDATKSWSAKQDEKDGDEGDGTSPLTAREQAVVDTLDFTFTLYKKEADATTFTKVANSRYYLLDKDGNVIGIPATDLNGQFTLKNGQTAKFMTDFPAEGVTYYVVEEPYVSEDGSTETIFLTPDYNFSGESTYGFDWYDGTATDPTVTHVSDASLIPEQELALDATDRRSYIVTAKGSVEAGDSLEFICVNYLDAELPNPTAATTEDIIVIDYGLPVQIDPLANDLFRGDNVEIVAWGDESLTLSEVTDSNGFTTEATWSGNDGKVFEVNDDDADADVQAFDSGSVELHNVDYSETVTTVDGKEQITYTRDSFTYTLNKQLTEVEVISYIIKVTSTSETVINGETFKTTACDYALARVYIVPATIMYYEENFNGLVTYSGTGTQGVELKEEEYVSAYQEPGVVGTVGDSTYGSDVAYLSDSHDSNGTSYKLDTTDGYARFQYTFTGTGTSFFARTSAKTGYMQVLLFEGDTAGAAGEQIKYHYRDTYWNDTNGTDVDGDTLYNIPVYTESDLAYGTYTLVVTVAKAGTKGAGPNLESSGNEFYLDGIRIMQPLNQSNETVISETTGKTITDLALGAYATDGESYLDVVTLRNKLIADVQNGEAVWDEENFVVLTDTNGAITSAGDYESIGPKEEVYLAPGQKVRFSLKFWDPDGLMLYAGMKAPFGSAALNVGNKPFTLLNATDCYYDVTDDYASLITVYEQAMDEDGNLLYTDENGNEVYEDADGNRFYSSNNAAVGADVVLTPVDDPNNYYYVVTYTFEATESIVSLTNIKVVGNFEYILIEDTTIDVDDNTADGDDDDVLYSEEEGNE